MGDVYEGLSGYEYRSIDEAEREEREMRFQRKFNNTLNEVLNELRDVRGR